MKELEKEFIPYEQALQLKELGFNEPCFGLYTVEGKIPDVNKPIMIIGGNSNYPSVGNFNHEVFSTTSKSGGIYSISAPLYQQAFYWFREKYNLKISFPYWNGFNDNLPKNMQYKYECYIIPENAPSITVRYNDRIFFETYEEAELACLIKLIECVKEHKIFYRVCNTKTKQGLWYDFKGEFTGLIHNEFNFCKHRELKMDFDEEIVGYLSATDSLETLYNWFPEEDIKQLQNHGYCIHVYRTNDYKFYERFQHIVINQKNSVLIDTIILE